MNDSTKPESKSGASSMEYVALKERINEAKCAVEKAKRLADEAIDLCTLRENSYAGKCHRLRHLELEMDILVKNRKSPWW